MSEIFHQVRVVLLLVIAGVTAHADIVKNYNYPYPNVGLSTLTVALARPKNEPRVFGLVPRPERNQVPISGGQNAIMFTIQSQPHPAPLVFVLPGLGGTANEGLALALAEKIFEMGFHAVTVNDPFSWVYSLTTSRTGLVGYTPGDAHELYQQLRDVEQQILASGVKATSTSLVGFSLGALYALHLRDIDTRERHFNFAKTVMINPPLQFLKSVQTVDNLYQLRRQWTPDEQFRLRSQAQRVAMGLMNRPMDENYYSNLDQLVPFNESQMLWLVGDVFRKSVTEVIIVSQRVFDRGILKTPESRVSQDARAREAARYSLEDYLKLFIAPTYTAETRKTLDDLIRESELKSFQNLLIKDKSIFMMHNENDFLIQPGDVAWIEKTLGSRARVYPTGGHVGNWWYKDNLTQLKVWLSSAF